MNKNRYLRPLRIANFREPESMNILNFEHVSKKYVSKVLLDDVTVGIEDTDRIGVVGINGTGKSTFLKIAAGQEEPDEGKVTRGRQVRISYLPQDPVFDPERSVLENVARKVSGKESHWNTEGEAKAVLSQLGITDPDGKPDLLSGGQRKRAALAAAILTPCDLLILDEPTNHLDAEMIEWLENFLESYKGALLMVTHDRYFLDAVTNRTLELDRGRAYSYEGGYTKYLEQKQTRMNFALAAERKAAALYRQDLAWMMRGARARSTKQKAHIQRFEQLRDREKIVQERQVQLGSLPSRIGNTTIECHDISKSYDGRVLFAHFTYLFGKTDRVGIIGPNGCGKTTLLKCLTGQIPPDEGTVEIGQTIQVGYFGQENQMPDGSERVIDYIRDTAEFILTPEGRLSASAMCEKFLFDPEMQYSPLSKLSGGEKRRLYLLKVLMENPNVLVLDEPTNDLDIQTLQILEDYLDHFAGIIITVSHDRFFLDRVVTRIFAFEPGGRLLQSEGGYSDWLVHRDQMDLPGQTGTAAGPAVPEGASARAKADAQTGLSGREAYEAQKEQKNRQPKRLSYKDQKEYDGIEAEIDALEKKSAALEEEMQAAATDFEKLAKLSAEKEETDAKLEERMERYLQLQDLVDALGS